MASDGTRYRDASIPAAAGEAAERHETDDRDDQSDPEAPDDHQHDPDDHDDAAESDAARTTATVSHCHASDDVDRAFWACFSVLRRFPVCLLPGACVGRSCLTIAMPAC